MNISMKSDHEILTIAERIRQDVIDGSNNNSWEQHSRHMPDGIRKDQEIRKDVERQWREIDYLSALSPEAEFMGLLRKKSSVTVCWRQTSTLSDDEYLLKIRLEEVDSEIKQVSASLD